MAQSIMSLWPPVMDRNSSSMSFLNRIISHPCIKIVDEEDKFDKHDKFDKYDKFDQFVTNMRMNRGRTVCLFANMIGPMIDCQRWKHMTLFTRRKYLLFEENYPLSTSEENMYCELLNKPKYFPNQCSADKQPKWQLSLLLISSIQLERDILNVLLRIDEWIIFVCLLSKKKPQD